MHKLLRFYNQNRIKVWIIILAIIIGLVMIQVLNNALREENIRKSNEREETTSNNVVSYRNESQTIISGGEVSSRYSEDLADVINTFLTYCVNGQPQYAYEMLSDDCKNQLYQTEELFEQLYYNNKFNGDKQFSFQSWSTSDSLYVYQVRIFDNMLSTGNTSDNYIEDFVTVEPVGGSYKLNVNSYLGREEINVRTENNNLSAQVVLVDKYLDYEIYTIRIKNKTSNTILLDTRKNTNTCYLVDDLGSKFDALLYENKEEDLKFSPQESKTIQIKFNVAYRGGLEIDSILFTNIVNYDDYIQNQEVETDKLEIVL